MQKKKKDKWSSQYCQDPRSGLCHPFPKAKFLSDIGPRFQIHPLGDHFQMLCFFGCGKKKSLGVEKTPKRREKYVFLKFILGIKPLFERTDLWVGSFTHPV